MNMNTIFFSCKIDNDEVTDRIMEWNEQQQACENIKNSIFMFNMFIDGKKLLIK